MDNYEVTAEQYEQAASIGISRKQVNVRVDNGWSTERAVTEPLRVANRSGDEFTRMAAQNGIARTTYRNRVNRGWDKLRAATEQPLTREQALDHAQQSKRIVTKEQAETARANGISHQTMHTRLRLLGWDVQRAITEPVIKSGRFLRKHGSKWNAYKEGV
jgi:predicted DNA-binding protein (UPF0251 family)